MFAAVMLCAVVALSGLFSSSRTVGRTILQDEYDLPDGVEPEEQLSFSQAVKAHELSAKKLDDVASRENLNSYFDKLGEEYHKESQEEKRIRADHHPGQIHRPGIFDSIVRKVQTLGRKNIRAMHLKDDVSVSDSTPKYDSKESSQTVNSAVKQLQHPVMQTKAATEDSSSTSQQGNSVTQLADSKVKVDFYMESMCPGCKYFTNHVLTDLITRPGFRDMVDLKVYPYGNGKLTGTSIQCQHGSEECEGNKIIACMQSLYPVTSSSLGFMPAFECLEQASGVPAESAEACAAKNGIDYAQVKQCAEGAEGSRLALEAARATEALQPPHEYAPWLTLNGQPLRDRAYDLKEEVCKAFSGDKKGTMCDEAVKTKASTVQALWAMGRPPVCYPGSVAAAPEAAARN